MLFLVLSFIKPLASNAQSTDPVTGLTLNSTGNVLNLGGGLPWDGTVTGAAGGFSGGNTPAYNPSTGNIIFGYNLATASQSVAINTALANAGTGIQISGYKYSWQIQNDLYNAGSNRGTLYGNVSLTGSTGLLLESFNYDYNYNLPSFTTFSGTQFFKNRYDPSMTGNLTVSFTGKDQNWWAGYYGPRVHVDNVSLLYTAKPVVVDPCSIDPLSSPICPGYALATIKNSILGTTVSNASAPIVTYAPGPAEAGPTPMPIEITSMLGPAQQQMNPSQAGPMQQQVMQQQGPMMGPMNEQQPPPPQQIQGGQQPGPAGPNPGPATMASSSPAPTANNPQPKIGEVGESSGGSKASTPAVSLSSVLNMISSNQDKTSALEKSVVQAADAQAFSAGETAKQQAEKIAGDVQSQSIANSGSSQTTSNQSSSNQSSAMQMQGSSVSLQGNMQSNTVSNSARLQQSLNSGSIGIQTESITFNATGYQQNNFQNNTRQDFSVSMVTPSVSYNIVAPTRYTPQVQIEMPSIEGIKFGNKSPVENAMDAKPMLPQMNQGQQQNDSVKRNVQNNEAAGNVTLESIAKQPVGYAQYFSAIPDAAFYAPKEIYKNQKTVDNVRALRQLSSDKLHQDMVNQQYK